MDNNELIYLNVPFEEKGEAKRLGARWNPHMKKWFVPKGLELSLFSNWLPKSVEPSMLAFPPIFLLTSKEICWSCCAIATVYAIACSGIKHYHFGEEIHGFTNISNLEFIPNELASIIQEYCKGYFVDYSKKANSHYYMNHCKCGAKLGDFYMHNEPGGAFLPMYESECEVIELYELKGCGAIKISGGYSFNDLDLIEKHAKRKIIEVPI